MYIHFDKKSELELELMEDKIIYIEQRRFSCKVMKFNLYLALIVDSSVTYKSSLVLCLVCTECLHEGVSLVWKDFRVSAE